jgi:hypothetical protein
MVMVSSLSSAEGIDSLGVFSNLPRDSHVLPRGCLRNVLDGYVIAQAAILSRHLTTPKPVPEANPLLEHDVGGRGNVVFPAGGRMYFRPKEEAPGKKQGSRIVKISKPDAVRMGLPRLSFPQSNKFLE